MTRWAWRHAEFRTHAGWVPQASVEVFDNGQSHTLTLAGDEGLAVDTRSAARHYNRELVRSHADELGWSVHLAENEDEW